MHENTIFKTNRMPKFTLLLPLVLILITSCVQEGEDSTNEQGDNVTELQNQIAQLELENSLKDSVINESLAFFNEIKSNLEAIGIRKDQIKAISEDPELTGDDKQWIMEEIRRINFLREENARKVKQLNDQIKSSGIKIAELEIMIESLLKDIQWKDEQINLLQSELDVLDKEYSRLFDAYQEQAFQVEQLTEKMNRVYYAYGTSEELSNNEVVERKNGFIGLGRKTELKDDFNEKYFSPLDASKTKSIRIVGKNPHFITDHPTKSYELVENGAGSIINILDPSEFWKISKYLVVVVD